MLKKILIIGSGGHSKVVINEIHKQGKYKIEQIIDIKNFEKIKIGKDEIKTTNYKNLIG